MTLAVLLLAVGLAAQDYSQPDFTHSEGTPWCFELEITGEPQDCALPMANDTLAMLTYTTDAAEDEWGNSLARVDVTHHAFDGTVLQSFSELVDRTYAVPEATDINNDGVEEILIPTYTGNVNTVWQVWHQVDDVFVDAGEVSGLGLEYDETLGLPSISSRGSASTWYRTVWYLDPVGLVLVYELVTDLGMESCSIEEGPAMQETSRTGEEIVASCEAAMGEDEL